jgi:acyl transferase domain-containing protein/phosphopantetheinyl transferase (holo-ACP synthase)
MPDQRRERDVAIVGMACIFPGAPELATFWRNLESGLDAVTEVPPARWDPVYYDPASSAADRFYCKRGGFIDAFARFDPFAFGVMPVAAKGAEPDQLLTLEVAHAALADAGYGTTLAGGKDRGAHSLGRSLARERTGVVLGRGNYIGAGMTRLEQHVRTAEQVVVVLRDLLPDLGEPELARVKAEFQSKLGVYGPDTAIGLVPNLTASRVANRLDLQGPAYTIDAACASSLIAVDEACRSLADHRTDVMLCGGVHLSHDVAFWSVFCQLGALSRSQRIAPFDRRADGILIGEGIGIVVLKRLSDAERDGDRIYAVIRGSGVASDGREASLLTPRVDGQVLALQRAYASAGIAPETVGLIEGHGTGTPAGDAAELTTLARFFGPALVGGRRAALGSVKSMIGHAMPAAGVAGLIKAALAVFSGTLPPSLHCDEPHPLLEQTRFRVPGAAEPWEQSGVPRRAGVSAFGFGGINAHVVLEAHDAPWPVMGDTRVWTGPASDRAADAPEESYLLLAADDTQALVRALESGESEIGDGPARLCLRHPTAERRARAIALVRAGVSRHTRDGIAFSPRGLALSGSKIAFLFPGVEASFEPRVEDVAHAFGRAMPPCTQPKNLEEQGLGIVSVGRFLYAVLRELGIRPDVLAGHSIGEWTACIASGMLDDEVADDFIEALTPGSLRVPDVVFAAVGCGADVASTAIGDLRDISVSHDNCPHQVILCGRVSAVDTALNRLRERRVLCQKLPFQSGFHSPLFEPYLEVHRGHFAQLALGPPDTPLWSATTCAPYPETPALVRELMAEHLVRPVRFRELVRALYDDGARVFVQVGTGNVIGFIDDTLRGEEHVAIAANTPKRSGLEQLRRLAGALFVEGLDVDVVRLGMGVRRRGGRTMVLDLGVPLVRLDRAPRLSSATADAPRDTQPMGAGGDRVLDAMRASVEASRRAAADVLAAWQEHAARGRSARATTVPAPKSDQRSAASSRRESTTVWSLSIASAPHLEDHCFFRQPEGWPSIADRYPVVPMTMTIARMMRVAAELVPGQVVVGVEGVRAYKWLAVVPPVDVTLQARFDGDRRVHVAALGFAEATIVLGESYAPPPAPSIVLDAARRGAVDAARLYTDHWMFHGPGYQGVRALELCGHDGIRGEIEVLPAEGALLDNAGQLFGYFVMQHVPRDRLAMPVRVDRIDFFGPDPRAGTRVTAAIRAALIAAREVRADLELLHESRVWARIEGWEDWRFESDDRLWPILREPERHLLADVREGGAYVKVEALGRTGASRDYLARRFLGESERADYERESPRGQRPFLLGRIAAKDAVRALRWGSADAASRTPVFPVEVVVRNDANGRPQLEGSPAAGLHVSLAHKEDAAVACVGRAPVGIDLEPIEPRSESFAEIAFSEDERALAAGFVEVERAARLWCSKEAVAKARGTGLGGNPRAFVIDAIDGERVRCDGLWVETRRDGSHIVAWTTVA